MADPNTMPDYERPPVTEVALAVEFSPLEGWSSSHALLFGRMIQDDFPKMEVKPSLPSQIERFGEEGFQTVQLRVEVVNPEVNRFWFMEEPSNWLIQIQSDRFIVNWRKVSGDEAYPHYVPAIRPRFERELQRFLGFLEQQGFPTISVRQSEVTYVNDMFKGQDWSTVPEALSLLSHLSKCCETSFLPPPEAVNLAGSYLLPEEMGRLRFSVNQVIRQLDNRESFQMRLTVRGKPKSSDNADILEWLDMGREWIVRGFDDLTTKKAHDLWGKR